VLLASAPAAFALNVDQQLWGFNGQAVPGRLALFSVLLSNPSPTVCETSVAFYKTDPSGARRGARLVRECFISPGSSKWVQFFPYVHQPGEQWILAWGADFQRQARIPGPALGPPATVTLSHPDDWVATTVGFTPFPENLFPLTVAATAGLHAVVMDRVPCWGKARRTAFVDWVRQGGTVHVCLRDQGGLPQFPYELGVLNGAEECASVGAGLVVRHALRGHQVSVAELAVRGHRSPVLKTSRIPFVDKFEDAFFRALSCLVQTQRSWGPIYLLIWAYIILIVPVNYAVGRASSSYRRPTLFLLLAVTLFGLTLNVLGRRRYGEASSVHTLSYARAIAPQTYDVTQWTHIFVAKAGSYRITHPSDHNLYSTCQDMETVAGVVRTGQRGGIDLEMPACSERSFLHRARMTGDEVRPEVVVWQGEDELTALELAVKSVLPGTALACWALHAGRFYRLALKDGRLRTVAEKPMGANSFFLADRPEMSGFLDLASSGRFTGGGPPSPVALFPLLVRPLIARSLGGTRSLPLYVSHPPAPNHVVQVFIFARSPQGFRLKADGLGREAGFTLYHLTLSRPGTEKSLP